MYLFSVLTTAVMGVCAIKYIFNHCLKKNEERKRHLLCIINYLSDRLSHLDVNVETKDLDMQTDIDTLSKYYNELCDILTMYTNSQNLFLLLTIIFKTPQHLINKLDEYCKRNFIKIYRIANYMKNLSRKEQHYMLTIAVNKICEKHAKYVYRNIYKTYDESDGVVPRRPNDNPVETVSNPVDNPIEMVPSPSETTPNPAEMSNYDKELYDLSKQYMKEKSDIYINKPHISSDSESDTNSDTSSNTSSNTDDNYGEFGSIQNMILDVVEDTTNIL